MHSGVMRVAIETDHFQSRGCEQLKVESHCLIITLIQTLRDYLNVRGYTKTHLSLYHRNEK